MHFMERKIIKNLITWKNNPNRQPLLLRGARQVGKTYTLLSFGKEHYKNVAYFSMEESKGINPYYWTSNGKAEVDFIFQDRQGGVIPLEAKSADNVRSKSLRNYCDVNKPVYSIRVSAKNFGYENGIKSIPLYAVFCLNV